MEGPPVPETYRGPSMGQTLKQFRVLARIGEGGMGVVYRAMDETLRREVALKVLPESLSNDDERRRRFLREARSAAAVTHPNIATVYEIGEADGIVFIAMELIAGKTLRELIASGMTHAEALRIAKEVARGLARAHEKGVVHRDLKPENVMVTEDGGVKILDFGLAKLRDAEDAAPGHEGTQMTVDGRIMGTPGYMSPEQASGRSDVGPASDVFSFGIMVYEMMVGTRPFVGPSNVAVLYAVMHVDAPSLEAASPDLPAELCAVVAMCLRKAPQERFVSGRELSEALGAEAAQNVSDAMSKRAPAAEKISTVSGMGTALGATIASGSELLHPPSPSTLVAVAAPVRSGRRGRMLLVASALAVLGASGAAFYRLTSAQAPRTEEPGTPPSVSAPALAVDMTAHPLPKTNSPEAAVHYASARQRLRIGATGSFGDLERAVALDPAMAAAQLRIVLYSPIYSNVSANERRSRFAKAQALGSTLEPRDQDLLSVAELIARDPSDVSGAAARTLGVLAKYPADAEMALLRYLFLSRLGPSPEAEGAARHVLELDPHATQVLSTQASRLARRDGAASEAATLVARCLQISPEASGCKLVQAQLDAEAGKCEAELVSVRELVRLESDDRTPYSMLAQSLDALDATRTRREAVKSALDQAEARRVTTDPREPAGLAALVLAISNGDFTAADADAVTLVSEVAASSSERDHADVAAVRIALAEETASPDKALEIAAAHAKQASARTEDAPLGVRMKRFYLLHEAGRLDDTAFAAARERRFASASTFARRDAATSAKEDRVRMLTDAEYAVTPTEAKAALARGPVRPTPVEVYTHGFELGRLLLLAGKPEDAVPLLERVATSCVATPDVLTLDAVRLLTPLRYVQAHRFLGEALEARGDTAGACKAYAVVEARWKGARPRSISLERATERIKALGCPPAAPASVEVTSGFLGQLDLRLLRMTPVEQDRATKPLGDLGLELRAETHGEVRRFVRALGSDPYLDELVRRERGVDGVTCAIGEARLAKLHDRLEVMAKAAEVARLLSGERHGFDTHSTGAPPARTPGMARPDGKLQRVRPSFRPIPVIAFMLSCGGATPPAAPRAAAGVTVQPEPTATAPAVDAPPAPASMPTTCSGDPTTCTPPAVFVDSLCNGSYLEASLALFAKGSPWTRGYLRGDVDGWYASGGGSMRARLLFDEEVVVLRVRAPASGGVVVGNGSTSYDVLRWDGFCYTVDSGELTTKKPPKAKSPPIPFHHLGEATQTALLRDDKVRAAHARRGKECHGVMTGDVSVACLHADQALADAVVEYVRNGGPLPPPSKVPGG